MDLHDGSDVPDSTDWLGTALACLMPVEQALRCHVCKDFYTSPMLTSCNHTFCSLCIRRCLAVDGKCPLCRVGDQESKLRGNWALREAVDAFCQARPTVLGVARKPPEPPVITVVRAASPPPRRRSKRKQGADACAGADVDDDDYEQHTQQTKRTRSSARLSKTRAAEAVAALATAQQPVDVSSGEDGTEDGDDDVDELGDQPAAGDADYGPDDGLVACPICWARMKPWQVDRHLDTTCPGSPRKLPKKPQHDPAPARASSIWQRIGNRSTPSTSQQPPQPPQPPPERLPSLSYSLLTDTALRKKLAQLGLATTGPRPLLERRHKEWATLWNANCDSARPKRTVELMHDLHVWERTMGAGAGAGGSGGSGGSGSGSSLSGFGSALASRSLGGATAAAAQIKEKDFDTAAWSARHSSVFKDLVANARASARPPPPAEETKATTDGAQAERDPEGTVAEVSPPLQEEAVPQQDAASMVPPPGSDLVDETITGQVVKYSVEPGRPRKELDTPEEALPADGSAEQVEVLDIP